MDSAKMLGERENIEARLAQLDDPHMAPLTAFVRRLRDRDPSAKIPNFDPWDGGTNAEILFLLEAPGPKARDSSFVSRNNPDETAKNFFDLNCQAEIARQRSVIWNVVPWYIGGERRIRPATKRDVESALPSLEELFGLLPKLSAIVLVGRKAQLARESILTVRPDLKLFDTPHPSPMFCNRQKGNRDRILEKLKDVAVYLREQHADA